MNTSLRIEDVYQRILIQTMQALQVETVALGMIEGENLVFRAAAGYNAGNILGRTIDVSEGIAAILKLKQETGCTAVDLIYTGSISPLARKELGARGVTLIPVKTS